MEQSLNNIVNSLNDILGNMDISDIAGIINKFNKIIKKITKQFIRINNLIDKISYSETELSRLENWKNNLLGKVRLGNIIKYNNKIRNKYIDISLSFKNPHKLGYQLSPQVLTTHGKIFSNIVSFSKLYEKTNKHCHKTGWNYKSTTHILKKDIELINDYDIRDLVTDEYWLWRDNGMNFTSAVVSRVKKPLGCIWPESGNIKHINNFRYPMKFINNESMDTVYQDLYMDLIKKTDDFTTLYNLIKDGYNIRLLGIDNQDTKVAPEINGLNYIHIIAYVLSTL